MLRFVAPLHRPLLLRSARRAVLLQPACPCAPFLSDALSLHAFRPSAVSARRTFSSQCRVMSAAVSSPSPSSHNSHSSTPALSHLSDDDAAPYAKLEARFLQYVPRSAEGLDALEQLRTLASASSSSSSSSPSAPSTSGLVVLLGGDQCTGKSTLCTNLSRALHHSGAGASVFGAGQLFRLKAKQLGISTAELSRRALNDPAIDVGIEFELCKLILTGSRTGALVIEGRQPVVMENFLRARFGRGAAVRLRLTCSVREQALRFIEREAGPEVLAYARTHLPPSLNSLRAALPYLPVDSSNAGLARLAALFADNDQRDEDDRARFQALYGRSRVLDYRTPQLYDAVIDTTHNQSTDTFRQAMEVVQRICPQLQPQSKL